MQQRRRVSLTKPAWKVFPFSPEINIGRVSQRASRQTVLEEENPEVPFPLFIFH